ncbi:MAG: permease [Chloroflexi bacterium]|nr:permease [Chloroflexota bacterium]
MSDDASSYDVLGLGFTAVDDLIYVAAYPPPDAKAEVRRRDRQCGGLTATALVAASRLGAHCAYAGALGDDELSRFVVGRLTEERIDLAFLRRRTDARPVHSIIVVDEGRQTRNIFFDLQGVDGADIDWPPPAVIRSARVLFVDNCGVEGMIRAARIAREAGIPVVADLERDESPHFAELLGLVDHLILSYDFAQSYLGITGEADPAAIAERLWTNGRSAVVITRGIQGCWYLADPDPGSPRHQPAYQVKAVDTTGCGDVFHGAYAFALARGLGIAERVRLAAAAAALKATRRGGQAGIPTLAAVDEFLGEGWA